MRNLSSTIRKQTEPHTIQTDPQPSVERMNHYKYGTRHHMIKKSLDSDHYGFMNKFTQQLPKEQTDQLNMKIPLIDHTGKETRKQMKKMLLHARHEDHYFSNNYDRQKNQNDLDFPQIFRIQNDSSQDTVFKVRNDLRTNHFDHQQFDPSLTSIDSRKYLNGIYDPNKKIEDADLVKTLGQYVQGKGAHKAGGVKIYELFEEIYKNKPKLEKKPDESKAIRQKLNREYPKMSMEMFLEQMYEIKRQNHDKPLEMNKEDKVLRYVEQKMKDISPYNTNNLKAKLRLLNELEQEGYQLKFLTKRELRIQQAKEKLAQTQETKKSETVTLGDLESVQEITECPLILTLPDELLSKQTLESKQPTVNSESGDKTLPTSIQPDEKAALRNLKEESASINQSSKINKSTVVDTNYNQVQKVDSMTGFDDHEVGDFGRSELYLNQPSRKSDQKLIRYENSQMHLHQPNISKRNDIPSFQNNNQAHFQSQVFNPHIMFLSQQTLDAPEDNRNSSIQKRNENASYGTVEVNETKTFNKSPHGSSVQSKSSYSQKDKDGIRSQEFRNRFLTVQHQDSLLDALDSRIDTNELPRIENKDNFDSINFDIDTPEIHSAIPDRFIDYKDEPHSILPLIDSARHPNIENQSFFPEIVPRHQQQPQMFQNQRPLRYKKSKIYQSVEFPSRFKTQLNLNHPAHQVVKEPKQLKLLSPEGQFNMMPYERQILEHFQNQRLVSQSEMANGFATQAKSPLTMRFQEQRRAAPVVNSKVLERRGNYDNQISQSLDFGSGRFSQIQKPKFQTQRKLNKKNLQGSDLKKQSSSVLNSQDTPFKFKVSPRPKQDLSPNRLSKSPTIRECRSKMKSKANAGEQKTSKKRDSLINILKNCGDQVEIEKASQKIHDQIDSTMVDLQEDMHNLKTIYQQYKNQFDEKNDEEATQDNSQSKNKVQFLVQPLKDFKEVEYDYWWNKNMDYELFLSPSAVDLVKQAQIDPNENSKKKEKVWQPNKLSMTKGISKIMGSQL